MNKLNELNKNNQFFNSLTFDIFDFFSSVPNHSILYNTIMIIISIGFKFTNFIGLLFISIVIYLCYNKSLIIKNNLTYFIINSPIYNILLAMVAAIIVAFIDYTTKHEYSICTRAIPANCYTSSYNFFNMQTTLAMILATSIWSLLNYYVKYLIIILVIVVGISRLSVDALPINIILSYILGYVITKICNLISNKITIKYIKIWCCCK